MIPKHLIALAAAATATLAACASRAQTVEFSIKPSHRAYVTGEPIDFSLRLANVGSTPVVVDDEGPYAGNRLWLEISSQNGKPAKPIAKPDIVDSLMLMPGETFTRDFEVEDFFPMLRQGRYFVKAHMLLDDRRYETNLVMIDVVPGLELASASQPIPGRPGHLREVRLVYLAREQREFVFLRSLDDGEEQTAPTLRLGTIVRIAKPTVTINPDGSITVRHQATRNRFQETHVISDAEGIRVEGESQSLDSKITPLLNALSAPESTPAQPQGGKNGAPQPGASRRPGGERPADGW